MGETNTDQQADIDVAAQLHGGAKRCHFTDQSCERPAHSTGRTSRVSHGRMFSGKVRERNSSSAGMKLTLWEIAENDRPPGTTVLPETENAFTDMEESMKRHIASTRGQPGGTGRSGHGGKRVR